MSSALLSKLNAEYYKGGFALCGDWWHYENILVGYDRLYYIVEGECVIDVNGIKYIARPGQLFFLPSNSHLSLYTEDDKNAKKYWLHCRLLCDDKNFCDLLSLPTCIEVDDRTYVEELFQTTIALDGISDLYAKLEQKAGILKLVSYFLRTADCANIDVANDNRISYIMSYIKDNLHRQISLEELSDLLHFHPSYFVRYFKAATGLTPISYINEQRILLAQKLLLDETLSIQDISTRSGFQSPYYFSRYFKKKTGTHPTEYRETAIFTHKPAKKK